MFQTTQNQTRGILPHNHKAASTWSAGGNAYDAISRQISSAIEHAVDRLDPRPGERILDVGTGTGWAARLIAERGAHVTAVDIGPDVIAAARELDPTGAIDFRVADAEALPFPEASFDGVLSTFGVMFCGDHAQGARELARVCRPGGRLSLANWLPKGSVPDMFRLIQSHRPDSPAPAPSPFAWGDTSRLIELLGAGFDLGFEEATTYYRDRDGKAAWEAFASGFGPVVTILSQVDAERSLAFQGEFEALYESYRTGAGILVPRDYLLTVGTRRAL